MSKHIQRVADLSSQQMNTCECRCVAVLHAAGFHSFKNTGNLMAHGRHQMSRTVSSAASTAPWLVLSNLRQIAAAITASDAEHSQCGVPICRW